MNVSVSIINRRTDLESYFYVRQDGEIGGPITRKNLTDLRKEGRINDETVVRQNDGQWTTYTELLTSLKSQETVSTVRIQVTPGTQFFYTGPRGEIGPQTWDELSVLRANKVITNDTLVMRKGDHCWLTLSSFTNEPKSLIGSDSSSAHIGPNSSVTVSSGRSMTNGLRSINQQSTNSPLGDFLTPSKWKPFLIGAGLFILVAVLLNSIGYFSSSDNCPTVDEVQTNESHIVSGGLDAPQTVVTRGLGCTFHVKSAGVVPETGDPIGESHDVDYSGGSRSIPTNVRPLHQY